MTAEAPPCRRRSVKPPVDAPASSHRLPSPVTSSRSRAWSSLWPPRETNAASDGSITIGSSGDTSVAARPAGIPLTSTLPASIARLACSREGDRPRRTSSASRREVLGNLRLQCPVQLLQHLEAGGIVCLLYVGELGLGPAGDVLRALLAIIVPRLIHDPIIDLHQLDARDLRCEVALVDFLVDFF